MPDALIALEDVRFAYPGGERALRGVSLRIEAGEHVALIGPNGAGKSTLLLALVGLVPAEGTIRVGGLELSRATLREIRRKIGLVFQDPDDQLFMPELAEDVAFGPAQMGLDAEEVAARTASALESVGLAGFGRRSPHSLSGGEKRAASLATVLSMRPEVLALDEPTAGLDPRSRRRFVEVLRRVGRTWILATHDLETALELCERAVLLEAGAVAADGPARAILSDAALMEKSGLEVPLSIRLGAARATPATAGSRAGSETGRQV